jgi:hypothetical protein
MAGWSLYCIGQPSHQNIKQSQKPTNKREKQNNIEFSMISQEEQMIAI